MALILESLGSQRCALDGSTIEAFTQKSFSVLLNESHEKQQDYYIARIVCANAANAATKKRTNYYCYDARQLCKSIFEMIISSEGRKVQIKNFKDPINQQNISELYFFRCRHDSETPLRAEYAGTHKDFLESQSFRSKIFYQEDPLDSLSVNFKFNRSSKIPLLTRKQVYSLILIVLLILLIGSVLVFAVERNKPLGGTHLLDYAISKLNGNIG